MTVICPRGAKRDTEPHASIDGIEIHRYPLHAAAGGPAGYLREYGVGVVAYLRLVRRLARRGRSTSSTSATRRTCCSWPSDASGGAARGSIFDQHDLVPELYLSRFGRGRTSLYRVTRLLERLTFRLGRRRDLDERVVPARSPSSADGSSRTTSSSFAARPTSSASGSVAPEPSLKRGEAHLLAYLGVMGPQDGVDHALRALATLRADARATGARSSSATATCCEQMVTARGRARVSPTLVEFTGRRPGRRRPPHPLEGPTSASLPIRRTH